MSFDIWISGRLSFAWIFTLLSNQTAPRVSPGLHHSFMYSFLVSHNLEDAAMQNAICLSSVFEGSVSESLSMVELVVLVQFILVVYCGVYMRSLEEYRR